MKEDLRYLEQLMPNNEKQALHPSDNTLANFIDGKLDKVEKEKMFNHLLICDACSDIVASTQSNPSTIKQLSKSKLQIVNVLMAMAASVLMFVFISFPDGSELGMLNLSKTVYTSEYKSPVKNAKIAKIINADKQLSKILSETDMNKVPDYKKALGLEEKELYVEARAMYKQAFISIRHNKNIKERMKQKIVINYRLLKLGLKEKKETDISIKEYKDMLRYDISIYLLQYQEEKR